MTPNLLSAIERLRPFKRILITGAYRSGVTLAGRILQAELDKKIVFDNDVKDFYSLQRFCEQNEDVIICSPKLSNECHKFNGAVLMLNRPLQEINESKQRIAFQGESEELARYFCSAGDSAVIKYAVWKNYQKVLTKYPFELDFEDFRDHPLFIKKEVRPISSTFVVPKTGVAIGHFNSPSALELNIACIRKHNPDVPILISDDASPGFCSTPPSGSPFDKVISIASRYSNVLLWPNQDRIGHAGGDMATFWKVIQWGKFNQMDVVYKLSQRFVIDIPNWCRDSAIELMNSGKATLARSCQTHRYDIRTEAVGMLVKAWYRPDVLAHLTPRKINCATEHVVWHDVRDRLGGTVAEWSIMSPGRNIKAPNILFRESNSEAEYSVLATKMGLRMESDFNCVTSPRQPNYILG